MQLITSGKAAVRTSLDVIYPKVNELKMLSYTCTMKEGDICNISIVWSHYLTSGPSLLIFRGLYRFEDSVLLRFSYPMYMTIEYCIYASSVVVHANFTRLLAHKIYLLMSCRSRKRVNIIREELMQRTWHPSRLIQTGAVDDILCTS